MGIKELDYIILTKFKAVSSVRGTDNQKDVVLLFSKMNIGR